MFKHKGVNLFFFLVITLGVIAFYVVERGDEGIKAVLTDQPLKEIEFANVNTNKPIEPDTDQVKTGISKLEPSKVINKAPEISYKDDLLTENEKNLLEEKIGIIEAKTAGVITEYDQNLSNIEKRKEIEARFASDRAQYKQIALKLAKDQIASEKLEQQNK